MNIEIRTRDASLPQPEAFGTTEEWLAALPPQTVLLTTRDNGSYRVTGLSAVEDLIDALAMAPSIQRMIADTLAAVTA